MNYRSIFILGSNPALSAAEIAAVQAGEKLFFQDGLLFSTADCRPDLIKSLGGTVKIARIIKSVHPDELPAAIADCLKPQEGKFKFGISDHSRADLNIRQLGMTIKTGLKQKGVSVRWVVSRDKILSSVVVEQNGLLKNGTEIILAGDSRNIIIARTVSVQAFKELSLRDYGRPDRDDHSGMIPPKLAQIMLNLSGAGKNDQLVDPFCGSGTILTEALAMGYRKIFGSDLSAKAVRDSRQNIDWTRKKFRIDADIRSLSCLDARKLSSAFARNSIDAIVTEPFLGAQRRLDPATALPELNDLYSDALAQFNLVLKPGGRIVMVWPALAGPNGSPGYFLEPKLNSLASLAPLPENLRPDLQKWLSPRGNLLYGRIGQKIWREIIVMEKTHIP